MSKLNSEAANQPSSSAFYRAVWRWHFYAGLYVIPFLMMLAVTGLFMLWFTAIAPEFGERLTLSPGSASLRISEQADAASNAHPADADRQNHDAEGKVENHIPETHLSLMKRYTDGHSLAW